VWHDIIVEDTFDFSYKPDSGSMDYVHVFLNNDSFDGICLVPKDASVSDRELEYRFFLNKKEVSVVASKPKKYDVFYIETFDDYKHAMESSTTDLFWMLTHNTTPDHSLMDSFYISHHDAFSRKQNHGFLHGHSDVTQTHDGIFLLSKFKPISKREVEYKHIFEIEKNDLILSRPAKYDIFNIETYDQYLYALENTKTEMFWGVTNNIKIAPDFDFSIHFSFDNLYDRHENHAFIHREGSSDYYNGVFLFSKRNIVTADEINKRQLVERKEWPIVASGPVTYDIFNIETYDQYLYALENTKTEMFWATSSNIQIDSEFKFDIYFNHNNEYDRRTNHSFIHHVDNQCHYNGVFLLSKHSQISKREIEHRFIVNSKEWPIVASRKKAYDKFYLNSYEEYLAACATTKTEMFWMIPNTVIVDEDFRFDTYFTHDLEYERTHHHAFLNGKYHDGIVLVSKYSTITPKEFNYGFIANKIETPILASIPQPFDVVFISYQEPNADENYEKLLKKIPHAKRVHGVTGIHQAHVEAAKLCNTPMFWIVDGDAEILNDFNFDYQIPKWDHNTVHVWRAKNPINDLVYGYGGVKLFPRELALVMDTSKPDMTTSISKVFKPMAEISNITSFNTDPFNTWKSAFRECCKLASKIIDRQKENETIDRLTVWKTVGAERDFGKYAIDGARQGEEFGINNKDDIEKLKLINNFKWLREKFDDYYR
jgi:hypothetical protein